jgi:Leucine-rich repeat (LRR) protein
MKIIILFFSLLIVQQQSIAQYRDWYLKFLKKDEIVSKIFNLENKKESCFIIDNVQIDWSSIHLEEYTNIRILDLSNCNIYNYKELLGDLSKLKKLEYLNISNLHPGTDTFSIENLNFRNLKWLSIANCNFKVIDESIGNLSNLEYLNLGETTNKFQLSNSITDLPQRFGNLRNLRSLIYSSNSLEDVPIPIFELLNLETLNLSKNSIRLLSNSFIYLKNLTELNIGYNKLDSFPGIIKELKFLKHLSVANNNISKIPENICELKGLKQFVCGSNPLKQIPKFECLYNLTEIDISNTGSFLMPSKYKWPPFLEYINISGTRIRPVNNFKYKNLKMIVLSKNKVSSKDIKQLNAYKVKIVYN